jgi:hypothetical protein
MGTKQEHSSPAKIKKVLSVVSLVGTKSKGENLYLSYT